MAAMFEIGSEPFEQSLVPPWVGTYMAKDSFIDPVVSEEKMLTDTVANGRWIRGNPIT